MKNMFVRTIYVLLISSIFIGCKQINVPNFEGLSQKQVQRTCVGEIKHVEEATIESNWGKLIGSITGGIIGNQFGGGTGKTISTVGGAVVGGYIGKQFDDKKNAQLLLIEMNGIQVNAIVKKRERLFILGDKVEFKLANNEIIDVILANNKNIGCSKFIKSINARKCNDLTRAGSNKKESHQVYLGNSYGEFDLEYETFTAKDRIVVRYDNQTLFDTGCIGTNGKLRKRLQYNGLSEEMTINVIPNCMGNQPSTKWNFQLICNKSNQIKTSKDFKTQVIVRGVMTERNYLNNANVWKYKVEQLDTNRYFIFTSKNKIMYKNDLIELKIVNSFVDERSIKLLKREYYKYKKSLVNNANNKKIVTSTKVIKEEVTPSKDSKEVSKEKSFNASKITKKEILIPETIEKTSNEEKVENKPSEESSLESLFGDDEIVKENQKSEIEELF